MSIAFDTEQYADAYPDGVQRHFWSRCRNRVILSRLKARNVSGRILEIGAGRGIVVEALRRKGFDCWGNDIAVAAPIDSAVAPFLIPGISAFDLESRFRAEIQALLVLDVLEHLDDPASFLMQCHQKFPNARYLLATVPARQEIWSNYDERYGHRRRYTLRACAELVGHLSDSWQLIRAGYFFHSLYLAGLALKILRRERSEEFKAPKSPIENKWHAVLGAAFYAEAKILPARTPGSSLVLELAAKR